MDTYKAIKIRQFTEALIAQSHEEIIEKIGRAIHCGAIDIDSWDENHNPMIIPKIIAIALLEEKAEAMKCKGTSFEKQVKKEVKNLKLFI